MIKTLQSDPDPKTTAGGAPRSFPALAAAVKLGRYRDTSEFKQALDGLLQQANMHSSVVQVRRVAAARGC